MDRRMHTVEAREEEAASAMEAVTTAQQRLKRREKSLQQDQEAVEVQRRDVNADKETALRELNAAREQVLSRETSVTKREQVRASEVRASFDWLATNRIFVHTEFAGGNCTTCLRAHHAHATSAASRGISCCTVAP